MKSFLFTASLFLLHVSGVSFLYSLLRKKELIVLVYHHVGDAKQGGIPAGYTIETSRFEKQMQGLSRRRVLSLEAVLAEREKGSPLHENAYLLTFDDGYQGFYSTVYPILQRVRLPATGFLPTEALDGKKVAWDPAMKDLSPRERGSLFLRWDQAREMEEGGIRFGSHGRSHADLTALDPERLQEELEGSWRDLKGHLSNPLPVLSYPFGLCNDAVEEAARKASYHTTFSLEIKQNRDFDFRLGRLEVRPEDPPFLFKAKLNGTYSLMKLFLRRVKGVFKASDR